MQIEKLETFDRNLKKLRIQEKLKKNILSDFEQMDATQASQIPYFKVGFYKAFKKYQKGQYRILFAYCKECYRKYRHILKCKFCSETNLERLVLYDIHNRSEGYD
jgi:hypothetical protein